MFDVNQENADRDILISDDGVENQNELKIEDNGFIKRLFFDEALEKRLMTEKDSPEYYGTGYRNDRDCVVQKFDANNSAEGYKQSFHPIPKVNLKSKVLQELTSEFLYERPIIQILPQHRRNKSNLEKYQNTEELSLPPTQEFAKNHQECLKNYDIHSHNSESLQNYNFNSFNQLYSNNNNQNYDDLSPILSPEREVSVETKPQYRSQQNNKNRNEEFELTMECDNNGNLYYSEKQPEIHNTSSLTGLYYSNTDNSNKSNYQLEGSTEFNQIPEIDYYDFGYKNKTIGVYLFTADDLGNQKQFDIKDKVLVKEYKKVHKGPINSMAISSDSKLVFTSDGQGQMKQFELIKNELILVQDYKQVHDGEIWSIVSTPDQKYIFTADNEGYLKQWSINNKKLYEDYGQIHKDFIYSIVVTNDSQYLFTSDGAGHQKQFSIKYQSLVKDYGEIHEGGIYSMTISSNSEDLFTSDNWGCLKQFSIHSQSLIRDYGKVHDSEIYCMTISFDSEYLFTSDYLGNVKKFSIREGKLCHDFGKVHESEISVISVTPDSNYLFTSDSLGNMKQFYISDNTLIKDYGKVHDGRILSMAISH